MDSPESARAAYDAAADVTERTLAAREELGPRTQVAVIEEVFVLAAPAPGGAVTQAFEVSRHAIQAYYNGRFDRRPERAVSVFLFPDASGYEAYCRRQWLRGCSTIYGFYTHEDRRIVMNVGLGVGTLTHELVHPIIESDFPGAPIWINEGIASLFEQFYLVRPGEIRGGKNWRHPRLLRAVNSRSEREHASLPALFALNDREFRGELEDLNYALARYFCQWLDQSDRLWPFYRRWRDTFSSDPSGERAFLEVTGQSLEQADAGWARWVQRL